MADKEGGNDEDVSNFWQRMRRNGEENTTEAMDASSDNPSVPDLGLGESQRRNLGQKSYGESSTSGDGSRREEGGSFSFKHFLQEHNSTGARPKVYDNPRPYSSAKDNNFRRHVNTPELASVLPDFVQDHLVVEQCYLADSTLDIDNLPDFALSGNAADLDLPLDLGQRVSHGQLPFDLTQLRTQPGTSQRSPPTHPNRSDFMSRPTERVMPLDLAQSNSSNEPLPLDLAQGSAHASTRNMSPSSSTSGTRSANENVPCDLGLGNLQQAPLNLGAGGGQANPENPVNPRLPDFLSDGPIQCGREPAEGLPGPEVAEQNRESAEVERLRRQLTESSRRCESLELELRRCRDTAHHREETLRRVNGEVASLRRENSLLRQGVAGDGPDFHTQRVARELMVAATHAELSLRQLLSGVESLRLLASSLDQGNTTGSPRPHPTSSPSTSREFDPEDGAGPAL